MFVLGTYVGIAVSLFIALALASTIRWQMRFGGFWPYSILFVLFLIPVALGTFVESVTLSRTSLEQILPNWQQSEITTIDQLRPFVIARNNSLMLMNSGFFFLVSALLAALTLSKARRIQRLFDRRN